MNEPRTVTCRSWRRYDITSTKNKTGKVSNMVLTVYILRQTLQLHRRKSTALLKEGTQGYYSRVVSRQGSTSYNLSCKACCPMTRSQNQDLQPDLRKKEEKMIGQTICKANN